MRNPILTGFNPDPSICRKGDTFYIATSSFQWWPAVPIYRSEDLRNWELYSYGITDPAYLNMERIQDSAGIWAPCLTYADGLFWLVFTIANGSRLNHYECRNYLTTAEDPRGPWSEPVFLNASGNDPSLFHDDDGRKWLVNTAYTLTPGSRIQFGTLLQEYSPKERRLVGPVKTIFRGTGLAAPEGSKIHKHGGWYYLITAEGGTEYGHQATMCRSRSIWGPYEVHPENPILTAKNDPNNPIQRAGHADIVDVSDDEVAVVYLASRPVNRYSLLGRETCIERARWCEDGWLRLESKTPRITLPDFSLPVQSAPDVPARDHFDKPRLDLSWNSLRVPIGDRVDLVSRPSWLCLKGTDSCVDSLYRPSLIAKRIRHHRFRAETLLEFRPTERDQWAGLICYYDTRHWYYLARLLDPDRGECLVLMCRRSDRSAIEKLDAAPLPETDTVRLAVSCDGYAFQFYFAAGGTGEWATIGNPENALVLSDEFVETRNELDPIPTFGFTGGMVGLASFDMTGRAAPPFFDWFDYRGEEAWPDFPGTSPE